MQKEKSETSNLYIPRKCDATNRIINSKDHASVQILVCDVDEKGILAETSKTYNFCGYVRALGEIDDSLNRLATKDGYLKGVWSGKKL